MGINSIISSKNLGQFSEYFASIFLILKAYTILHIRYKNCTGEVDIIARKGKTLIFIEVKSRRNLDLSYSIIRNSQISRIKNTALFYLQKNNRYNDYNIRFDLMIISNFIHIEHIKNAWQ